MSFDKASQDVPFGMGLPIAVTFSNFFLIGVEGTLTLRNASTDVDVAVAFDSQPDPSVPQGTIRTLVRVKDYTQPIPVGTYTVTGATFETTYEEVMLDVVSANSTQVTVTSAVLRPEVAPEVPVDAAAPVIVHAYVNSGFVSPTGEWHVAIATADGATAEDLTIAQDPATPGALAHTLEHLLPGTDYVATVEFLPAADWSGFTPQPGSASFTTAGTAPTPSSSPTPSPSTTAPVPVPAADPGALVIVLGVLALLLIAGLVTIVILMRRSRAATAAETGPQD